METKVKKLMKLAVFLKTSRVNAGLSQAEVADHLGYSTPQFISNWERGVSNPPIENVKKLAKLYKISADELFDVLHKVTLDQMAESLRLKIQAAKKA